MKAYRILGILLMALGSCIGISLLWRNRFMEGNLLSVIYPLTGFHFSIDLFLILLGPAFLFLGVVGYFLFRGVRWAKIATGIVAPLALTLWIFGLVVTDPIDRLLADLSSTNGMWQNGYVQFSDWPESASTEEVVNQFFKKALFDAGGGTGKVTSYIIVKIRQVRIPSGNHRSDLFNAVLALTNLGEKIFLLKSDEGRWGRAYDANRTYFPKIDMHETPLHLAVNAGNKELVERLLANKVNVNARNLNGWTPLFYAAMANYTNILEMLLTNHAEVNVKDHSGETPLSLAATFGHRDAAELLLANGADINAKGVNGWTPLQTALHGLAGKEFVELLLAHKADVNAKDYIGETALHCVAEYGIKDMVDLLLNNQADVNATNAYGWTPMHYAVARDDQSIIDLLRQHGGHE
jgi:hypothetical protein